MTQPAQLAAILEATRLTQEGRLAEATALLHRTLGLPPLTVANPPGIAQPPAPSLRIVSDAESLSANPLSPPFSIASPKQQPPSPANATTSRDLPSRPYSWGRPFAPSSPLPPLRDGSLGVTIPFRQPGRPAPRSWPGTWISATYDSRHGSRSYRLYIPSTHNQDAPAPALVVMLHGCTQNADDFAAGTSMNDLAESSRFLVVYPEQDAAANASRCWNWFAASHQQRDQGEPAILAGITRQVVAEYHLDADRLYVAGLSSGGAMAAILGASYPDLFAAVGVHSGLAPGSAHDLPSAFQAMRKGGHPVRPLLHQAIPLILFHGDRDLTVSPRNADELVNFWTASSSTEPLVTLAPGQANGKSFTRATYRDTENRLLVERWTIHGAGHAWSGGHHGGSYTDPSGPAASVELARFLLDHTRMLPKTYRL